MGTTKRMSLEEKRKLILDIYHKSKSVFTEKEILSLASKQGVTSQSVGDVNQSLVDDGLVEKEKIGGSNYFWSFPGKKDRLLQKQHEETLKNIEGLKKKVNESSAKLADAKRGREDENGERPKKLARLKELKEERTKLEKQLEVLKENDPQAIADLQKELVLCREAAHRWTDNIFACKSYLVKKKGMSRKEADKLVGITSAFDYPEEK